MLKDLDGQQEGEHQLVALEEGSAHVDVQRVGEVGVEGVAACSDALGLGGLLNAAVGRRKFEGGD